ncbi:MAG: LamG-like jellyroll fold domain-containing protein [Dehalococcoidia bacterium]
MSDTPAPMAADDDTGPDDERTAEPSRFLAHSLPLWAMIATAIVAGVLSFNSIRSGVFNSPDEMGNFLTARALAENGQFSLDPYVDFGDPEGVLHPRAFVVFEGRPTTIQFAMTPMMHAPGHFLTDAGRASAGFWAVFGVLGLGLALRRLCRDPWAATLGLLAGAPLLYWLMHQYSSATSFIVFAGWTAWAALVAVETNDRRAIAAAVVFASAGLAARPDWAPVMGLWALLGVGMLWRREGRFGWSSRLALGMAVAVGVLAIAGQLLYGLILFGDPFENGRALYLESVGADFPVNLSATNPFEIVRNLLFPVGVPDVEIAAKSIWKYYLATAPVLSALLVLGLVLGLRQKRLRWFVAAFFVLVVYVVLSRLKGETITAATWSPSFASAIARYFVPSYLICLLGIAPIALRWISAKLGTERVAVLTALVGLVTISGIGFQFNSAYGREADAVRRQEALGRLVQRDTGGQGVVFTSLSDKGIAPFVNTASTMVELTQTPTERVVSSIRRLLDNGVPAYLYFESQETYDGLTKAGFGAVPTAPGSLLKRIIAPPAPFQEEVAADRPLLLLEGGATTLPQAASDAVNPSGPVSFEFWLKFDADVETPQGLLSKVAGDRRYFAPVPERGFELAINKGELQFSLSGGSNVAGLRAGPINQLADGQWHHLVITWDGRAARQVVTLYVDGVLQVRGNSEITAIQRVPGTLNVGGDGTAAPFKGQIGVVAIYDQALTLERVLAHLVSGQAALASR